MKKLFLAMMLLTGAICFTGATVAGQTNTTTVSPSKTNTYDVKTVIFNEKGDSVLTTLDLQLNIVDSMVESRMNRVMNTILNKIGNNRDKSAVDVVGIVVPVVFFIACCIIIFLVLWFNYKNKQKRYELMLKELEAGKSISILEEAKPKREKNAFYYLKNGLFVGCIGLAFVIYAITDMARGRNADEWFFIGLLLIGIAVPFVIIGRLMKKAEQQKQEEQQ